MIKIFEFMVKFVLMILTVPAIGFFCLLLSLVLWDSDFIQFPNDVQNKIWE